MKYWLLKSEPDTFSIDDLKRKKKEPWTGVRNYQARNFMRDQMGVGDKCLFYHSSCKTVGIVGICKVSRINIVDPTQFQLNGEYFDPKSKIENPVWICVEISFVKKFNKIFSLAEIKADKHLKNMKVLQRGSRLSIQPVDEGDFNYILSQN